MQLLGGADLRGVIADQRQLLHPAEEPGVGSARGVAAGRGVRGLVHLGEQGELLIGAALDERSEEHTSELQSPCNLVCRLLLETKTKSTRFAELIAVSICLPCRMPPIAGHPAPLYDYHDDDVAV